ncbi:MAG TPA: glucose-1-phosphate adenylyltransferase, partial [Thermoguttaceae bacterium]|nr:glucose-1-phosphate adenylyltransferase [Thermoguttaceae bacterium]
NVQDAPIFSRARFLPPTRMDGATIRSSLVADGCLIGEGTTIENSIIGLRSIIGRNVTIRNAVLMGNDFFQIPGLPAGLGPYGVPLGIGEGTVIENAIIDKNCCIGPNCLVAPKPGEPETPETEYGMVRDGVLVIPKSVTLGEGWRL